MGKLFLITLVLMAIAFLALGIAIFFGKKKKFPEGSISKNKDMQQRGITCVKHEEYHSCGLNGGCCGNHEVAKND
ncbi:MAG: hypothetical protein KBB11_05455 [Bacteroidales bacterium]|nr:hypothetical protein [Bacteroidales bacterium]HOY39066.1 hypothetical protein [Bacteroidales bacterium]HQN93443.1 hypothetical protein [Prolixibacteraceae bacterium]